jgi:hypothetical protein
VRGNRLYDDIVSLLAVITTVSREILCHIAVVNNRTLTSGKGTRTTQSIGLNFADTPPNGTQRIKQSKMHIALHGLGLIGKTIMRSTDSANAVTLSSDSM